MNNLETTRDVKLFAAAAQKQVTIKPIVVARYIGRFPYFTARALKMRLPTAMHAIGAPCMPMFQVAKDTLNDCESWTYAGPRRGPTARMSASDL
jgi:hypothetical protein